MQELIEAGNDLWAFLSVNGTSAMQETTRYHEVLLAWEEVRRGSVR